MTQAKNLAIGGANFNSSGDLSLTTGVTGTLPVANGGTGATTQAGAAAAVLPSQTGNSGKYLTTDGTDTSWGTVTSNPGTVTSVAASVPSVLSISGSPITSSGTLAITYSGTALPVANGGTGSTTLTSNNVLLGNGTSALQAVAPSTSGNVLTSNGTTWVSSAPGGGGTNQFSLATYTSAVNSKGSPLVYNSNGNFTWTAPAGVASVKITAIGGGCGINNYGGFNGAGGLGIGIYTVTPGSSYSVLVGAAGAGLTGLSGVPSGGTSSFGSLISATGGSGGSGGGSSGSSSNANLRNANIVVWQPLGGPAATEDGSGCRACTIDWAINTLNGSPGATNPNNGYAVSGVVYIEYIG